MSNLNHSTMWGEAPTLRQLIDSLATSGFPMDAKVVIDNDTTALFDDNYRSIIDAQIRVLSDGQKIVVLFGKNA